jgi:hypothetical protein
LAELQKKLSLKSIYSIKNFTATNKSRDDLLAKGHKAYSPKKTFAKKSIRQKNERRWRRGLRLIDGYSILAEPKKTKG